LRGYALYLAGEKRKAEEQSEVGEAQGRANAVENRELQALEGELVPLFERGALCPFSCYLLGLVLSARGRKAEARAALVRSLNAFPCNWSAWSALQPLCCEAEVAAPAALGLAPHWLLPFFAASLALELGMHEEALQRYEALAAAFPGSAYVAGQRLVALYGLKQFEPAAEGFAALAAAQPFRLDGLDIYSNILYVTEEGAALAALAHAAVRADKYRPETCCVVGNYYSLRRQHDTAVAYFRRALRLDGSYLAAWTLMGHEYVEMRNTAAAVAAYRAAVQLQPRDYRAWYGLGQTYELLALPLYALHYYERAAALRPADARMWVAMGNCYERMAERGGGEGEPASRQQAVRCFGRALALDAREAVALSSLARLHADAGEMDAAAHYYRRNVQRLDEEGASGEELVDALSFLTAYEREAGHLRAAELYGTRMLDLGGRAHAQADEILRDRRVGGGTGSMEG